MPAHFAVIQGRSRKPEDNRRGSRPDFQLHRWHYGVIGVGRNTLRTWLQRPVSCPRGFTLQLTDSLPALPRLPRGTLRCKDATCAQ